MRFTTKTEYGLVCLIYMARNGKGEMHPPITIKELVSAEDFSPAYIEKILQSLRAAKIVNAVHGSHGGYILARPAAEITVKEVIDALEGATFDIFCEPDVRKDITCTHFSLCGIKPLWGKTKEMLDHMYEEITLEMLATNKLKAEEMSHGG